MVIPSNPYDAKGLMISAIRDVDPVVFCHYPMPASGPEVPDEPYTVPIGEPVVRTEGKDITIVGYAPQTVEIARAVEELKKDGISAEFIDPRTLAPLEGVMPTIIESVKKTGRLLTSDDGSYSFCNCAEIVARVAEAVPGHQVQAAGVPRRPRAGRAGDAQLHAGQRRQDRGGGEEDGPRVRMPDAAWHSRGRLSRRRFGPGQVDGSLPEEV